MPSGSFNKRAHTIGLVLFTLAILLLADVAQASFKKPPFNGSIFGKRANAAIDYDGVGRSLSSLCEVAVEACSLWFPQMDAQK